MNTVKTVFFMSLMIVLMILVGGWFGGRSGAMIAFGFALLFNFGSFFFSDRIVLKMYGARALERSEVPWLYAGAERIAAQAGIPVPRLFVIDSAQPNAFATGRNPSHGVVAVSAGLLNLMSKEEVEGVVAHEMAHIKNRDTLIAATAAAFAGAIMFTSDMVRWGAFFGSRDNNRGGIVGTIAVALIAPIAATLIQMAISRSREFAADESAARYTGSPLGLASALEKLGYATQRIPMDATPATAHLFIVNPFSGGGLMSLFSTHPPLTERIRRLHALAGLAR